jgi:hypothetical protein
MVVAAMPVPSAMARSSRVPCGTVALLMAVSPERAAWPAAPVRLPLVQPEKAALVGQQAVAMAARARERPVARVDAQPAEAVGVAPKDAPPAAAVRAWRSAVAGEAEPVAWPRAAAVARDGRRAVHRGVVALRPAAVALSAAPSVLPSSVRRAPARQADFARRRTHRLRLQRVSRRRHC